jgi:hypothetical protein
MDASSLPPNCRRQVPGADMRASRRFIALHLCLGFLGVIILLGIWWQQGIAVQAAPLTHRTLQQDPTPTPPPSGPPTLTLAVPASGQGPVGARLTIIGSNWGTSDVQVGIAAPGVGCGDPNAWAQTLNHVRPAANQSIIYNFIWPSSLNATSGPYSVCAVNGAGSGGVSYQLLAVSPPALTVNPTTTNAGAIVTVSGTNFIGSGGVTLSVKNAQGETRNLTTLSPDATGSFSLQYQPRPTDLGDVTLRAFTSAPQGMRPALDANARLHVDTALTPTPGITPTVQVGGAQTGDNNNSSLILVVVGIAVFLMLLVGVAGIVFFVLARGRKSPGAGSNSASGYPGGGGPGYGGQGGAYGGMYPGDAYMDGNPGWDAPTQDRLPTFEQGAYPPQTGHGAGVNGWPESDDPDPGWRPRPMTGQWRAPNDYNDDPYGAYGARDSGRFPPDNSWSGQPDPYYESGQSNRGDRSSGRSPRDNRPGRGSGSAGGDHGDYGDPHGGYPQQRPDDDW